MTHLHARAPCAYETITLPSHYFETNTPLLRRDSLSHWLPDMDLNHD